MTKQRLKQLQKLLRLPYPTQIYTIILICLCLIPGSILTSSGVAGPWPIILHFAEFILLGFLVIMYLRTPQKTFLYCLAIAIITEIIQYFVPGRIFDILDIWTNLLGSVTGIAIGSEQLISIKKQYS